MYAAKYFIKHGEFRHIAYMCFECLHCSSKSLFKMSRYNRKRKCSRTSIDSSTTASDMLIFAIYLTLWPFSYYLLTWDLAWVFINLICVLSNVMRGQFLSLSITCKIIQAASGNMQNLIFFSSAKFWKQITKPSLILWNSLKKLERHHSSRNNLGIENFIWIIQNHSKSVW